MFINHSLLMNYNERENPRKRTVRLNFCITLNRYSQV